MLFGSLFSGYWILFIVLYGIFSIWIFLLIIRAIFRAIKGGGQKKPIGAPGWFLQMSLSKEDGLSQWFWLLALGFFGILLFTWNRNFGALLAWHTVLLLCLIAGLALSYGFRLFYTLVFSLIAALIWWAAKASEWAAGKDIQGAAVLVGLAFIALLFIVVGTVHEIKIQNKRAALTYEVLGIMVMAVMLFLLSSSQGLRFFEESLNGGKFYLSWQITVGLLLLFAALIAAIFYGLAKKLLFTAEAVSIGLLALLFAVIAFLPQTRMQALGGSYYFGRTAADLSGAGVVWALIFNFVTLLGMLSVILAGYLRRENWQINLGAVLLCLFAFSKYVDWFYSFMNKSLFFVGAGVLLLAVGFMIERGRKKIVQKINAI